MQIVKSNHPIPMNDTPRTDAVTQRAYYYLWDKSTCDAYVEDDPEGEFVYAIFARSLERENQLLRQHADALCEALEEEGCLPVTDAYRKAFPSTQPIV